MKWLVSWSLYQSGRAVSWVMDTFGWDWLYRAYNWCMVTSLRVQGNTNNGPWRDRPEEDIP